MRHFQISFVLLLAILFTSCSKENNINYKKYDCFKLVYPISYLMPDDSILSLSDEKDAGMKNWYLSNPDVEEKPVLEYPVQHVISMKRKKRIVLNGFIQ